MLRPLNKVCSSPWCCHLRPSWLVLGFIVHSCDSKPLLFQWLSPNTTLLFQGFYPKNKWITTYLRVSLGGNYRYSLKVICLHSVCVAPTAGAQHAVRMRVCCDAIWYLFSGFAGISRISLRQCKQGLRAGLYYKPSILPFRTCMFFDCFVLTKC